MKIGIDISQVVYEATGVGEYTKHLVEWLLKTDSKNEYVLFFSHPRKQIQNSIFKFQNYNSKFKIKGLT